MGGPDSQSRLWFPLYNVVKVLGVAGEGDHTIADVQTCVAPDYTVVVVRATNGGLVFRFVGNAAFFLGLEESRYPAGAVVRASSYFSDRGLQIVSTCLSPEGSQLLTTCADNALYIVPVASLLFPSNPGESIDHPYLPSILTCLRPPENAVDAAAKKRTSKVFTVEQQRTKGRDKVNIGAVVGSVWWRSADGEDYAVSVCAGGFVVITDLDTRTELRCIPIALRPHALHLSHDTSATYLLVQGRRGMGNADTTEHSCAILLEYREAECYMPWQSVAQPHDTFPVHGVPAPPLHSPAPFDPVSLPPFSQEAADLSHIWTGPLGRGKNGVVSFRPSAQEVMCYDASLTPGGLRNPLYVYHVGPGASKVHLTSGAILFAHVSNGHQKITVLSRHAASAHPGNRSLLGVDTSVLQEVLLSYERVQGFASVGRGPCTSSDSFPVEGVLVWTDDAVYELQPAHPPEELFQATLLHGVHAKGNDAHRLLLHAESLGKAFHLDIVALYEAVANVCRRLNMRWALQLYKRVDMRPLDYLCRLTKYGGHDDVLKHVATYMKLGYEGLNPVLFLSAMETLLSYPRRNGVPALPRPPGLSQSLSRVSEISLESDDNASRTGRANSVKSGTGRGYGLGELEPGEKSRSGLAPSTRASAHATAASANDAEASTAKTYEDETCIDTTYLQLTDNEPVPDPLLALSSAISATEQGEAREVVATLCEMGMVERALVVAGRKGLVGDTLLLLQAQGCYKLPAASVEHLVEGGHAQALLSHSALMSSLSPHSQLLVCLAAVAAGDATHLPRVGPLLMICVRPNTLRKAHDILRNVSVEHCVLPLLRLAHVTETHHKSLGATSDEYHHADDIDQEVCELLRNHQGWSPTIVKRHATATGRLRVVSATALIEREHETAVVYFMMWLRRRFGAPLSDDGPAKVAYLAAELMQAVLEDESSCVTRRRCLRMGLAFFQASALPVDPLVHVLRTTDVAEDVRNILLASPSLTEVLPVQYRLDITREYIASHEPPPHEPSEYEEMSRAIPIPPDILKQAKSSGKDYVFFTCRHAPMPVSKFVKKVLDVQEGDCPATATVLKHIANQVSGGHCRVFPQGCPKCVMEQLPESMTRAVADKPSEKDRTGMARPPASIAGLMPRKRGK